MAALDWSQCPAVESIPGKVSGAWVFKGTRTPVAIVFENLEDGMTINEVMEQFPVTREQIKAVSSSPPVVSTRPCPAADARLVRQGPMEADQAQVFGNRCRRDRSDARQLRRG